MQASLIEKARQIFEAVLEAPAAERSQAIRNLCGEDGELAALVGELIAAAQAPGCFLDEPLPQQLGLREPELLGRKLGAYRLVQELGRGGYGTVFRAERTDGLHPREVAVKVLHAAGFEGAPRRRFERELRILSELKHPAIVQLLNGGVSEDGLAYLIVELVRGEPVTRYCERRRLEVRERVKLVVELCEAVAWAHRHLVVHRDLKPANILVDMNGRIRLLDFGVAKLLEDAGENGVVTDSAPAGMTWGYASPEQLRGGRLTTAADQYAIGLLLYELVTGRRPWQEWEATPGRLIREMLESAPPSPRRRCPGLPRDLEAVIQKALQPEPNARYPSVDALREDLERFLAGRTVMARPAPFWTPAWRFCRRHWVATMAVLTALALAGAQGAGWWEQRQQMRLAQERENFARIYRAAVMPFQRSEYRSREQALEVIRQAATALERAAQQEGLSLLELEFLAGAAETLGDLAGHPDRSGLGDLATAHRLHLTAVRLTREALARQPGATEIQVLLVGRLELAGGEWAEMNRLEEAERTFREALALNEALLQDARRSRESELANRLRQANLRAHLSRVSLARGKLEECIALRRQAVEEAGALAAMDPLNHSLRDTYAGLKGVLGRALREKGDYEGALREYEEASAMLSPHLAPEKLDYFGSSLAGRTLNELGRLLLLVGRYKEAEKRLAQAAEVFRQLQAVEPMSPRLDRTFMRTLAYQAEAGARLKRPRHRVEQLARAARALAEKVAREQSRENARVREELEEVWSALVRAGFPRAHSGC